MCRVHRRTCGAAKSSRLRPVSAGCAAESGHQSDRRQPVGWKERRVTIRTRHDKGVNVLAFTPLTGNNCRQVSSVQLSVRHTGPKSPRFPVSHRSVRRPVRRRFFPSSHPRGSSRRCHGRRPSVHLNGAMDLPDAEHCAVDGMTESEPSLTHLARWADPAVDELGLVHQRGRGVLWADGAVEVWIGAGSSLPFWWCSWSASRWCSSREDAPVAQQARARPSRSAGGRRRGCGSLPVDCS